MEQLFIELKKNALEEIEKAPTLEGLEAVRVKYLSRKGEMARLMSKIAGLSDAEKPKVGKQANEIKQTLQEAFSSKQHAIQSQQKQSSDTEDATMPGYVFKHGSTHPITKTTEQICSIFENMGFAIVEGPEIETEYNNFEALNIPLEHPSRDAFDTFYVKDNFLLRSHTSPVQVRYMQNNRAPFAIVVPGKVYRPDAVDASHSFMFHQVEGLMVSETIRFSHLKGVLLEFCKQCFGVDIKVRFRPHFFPFTEPSVEVDVACSICKGAGCSACSQKGWLEILGAGMVDPAVFCHVGIDAKKYSGFAFGMGVDRIAMLKYGINDIRLFYENDLRFLEQF